MLILPCLLRISTIIRNYVLYIASNYCYMYLNFIDDFFLIAYTEAPRGNFKINPCLASYIPSHAAV